MYFLLPDNFCIDIGIFRLTAFNLPRKGSASQIYRQSKYCNKDVLTVFRK